MLGVLVDWVEKGSAPGPLVQVAQQPQPPFAVMQARPLCRYPEYPHFVGGGDPARAESYACRASRR
jgi:hypothetical protein